MRNPFRRKKSFTPIPDRQVIFSVSQLIDAMFGDISAGNKNKLLKAGIGTVYACSNRISNSCASAPLRLYTERKASGIKTRNIDDKQRNHVAKAVPHRIKAISEVQEVTSHPALDLLNTMNDNSDNFRMRKLTWKHRCLTGDAFWYLIKGGTQTPIEIHILPAATEIIEAKNEFRKIANYKVGNTEYKTDEIIHFVYEDDEEKIWTYGKSPLQAVIDEYNITGWLMSSLKDRAKTKFGTDIYLKLGEKADRSPEQKKAIKEQMENYRTGNIKANEVMTIGDGELMAFPLADKDLPYGDNLKIFREFICNAYNVPISFFTESSTRAVQGTQATQYYADCITPLLIADQETLTAKYLPFFPNTDSMYFAYDSVIPEDRKTDAEVFTKYVGSGIMTINEVRYELNLDAQADGDQLLIPSNMMPLGADIQAQVRAVIDGVMKELKGEDK